MTYRILITGSRDYENYAWVEAMIMSAMPHRDVVVVHGECPDGPDMFAMQFCERMGIPQQGFPGKDFPSFKARNQHMVNLGADVCLAFATKWASGTGQTARMARRAGIATIDYGVSTV